MRAFSIFPASTFGWSAAQPPKKYEVKITQYNFNVRTKQPRLNLIQAVGKTLIRESTNDAGFCNVTGLETVFNNPNDLETATQNLALAVANWFKENHLNKHDLLASKPMVLACKKTQDGASNGQLIVTDADDRGQQWTIKRPHFDGGSKLFCHLYWPTTNTEGGAVQVFDIAQYLKDNQDVQETDVMDPALPSGHHNVKEGVDLSAYGMTFDTHKKPTVVFINNTRPAWIAHGATPVTLVEPQQPFDRAFHRFSLTYKINGTPPSHIKLLDINA